MGEQRLSLDPALAAACVQRFDPGGCGSPSLPALDPLSLFMGCADPFVGLIPDGSPCRLADECAKLDPKFEKALAEEGLGLELESWPEY